jgi:hypothetical protein
MPLRSTLVGNVALVGPYSTELKWLLEDSMAVILQMSWVDPTHDIRRYPAVLDGIIERLQTSSAEYIFLDSQKQIQEVHQRIATHVPAGEEPYVGTIYAGAGSAREIWTAMMTAV